MWKIFSTVEGYHKNCGYKTENAFSQCLIPSTVLIVSLNSTENSQQYRMVSLHSTDDIPQY